MPHHQPVPQTQMSNNPINVPGPVTHPKKPEPAPKLVIPQMSASGQPDFDPSRSRRDRERETRKRAEQDAWLRSQQYATYSGGVRSSATSGSTREGRPLSAPGEEYMSSSMPGQRRSHHRSNSQHGTVGQTQTLGRVRGARVAPGAESPDNDSDSRLETNGNHHKSSPVQQAFERWETLSSHWEGLTGYWIRYLEQNTSALSKIPLEDQERLNSHMSRQISDLSAAGANLFHAVVELQRLRSSSEKKFKRWFYETRAEQARAKDIQLQLEAKIRLQAEEQLRTMEKVKEAEFEKSKTEGLLAEVKRELQISREEARRAWEELGRREQEERERVNNLRNGQQTIVGGVQVIPMQPVYLSHMGRAVRQDESVTGHTPYPTSDHAYDARTQLSMSPVTTDPYADATPEMHDPRSIQYDGPAGLGITTDIDMSRGTGTPRGIPEVMSDGGSEYDVMTPGVGAVEAGGITPKRQRYSESIVSEEDYGTEIEPQHEKYRQNRNYLVSEPELSLPSPGNESYSNLPVAMSGYPSRQPQYGTSGLSMSMPDSASHRIPVPMPGNSGQQKPASYAGARYEIPMPDTRHQPSDYRTPPEMYPEEHDESFDSTGTVTQDESPVEHTEVSRTEPTYKSEAETDPATGKSQDQKWESVAPRHRHPTRLSAVYEDDERSRASGAQSRSVSMASHPE